MPMLSRQTFAADTKKAPLHTRALAPLPPGEAPENAEHAIVGTVELSAYFHLRQPEEKLNHQVVGEIQAR